MPNTCLTLCSIDISDFIKWYGEWYREKTFLDTCLHNPGNSLSKKYPIYYFSFLKILFKSPNEFALKVGIELLNEIRLSEGEAIGPEIGLKKSDLKKLDSKKLDSKHQIQKIGFQKPDSKNRIRKNRIHNML